MSATDDDAGVFGDITYSIDSPPVAKETFTIDNNGKKERFSNTLMSVFAPLVPSLLTSFYRVDDVTVLL